MQIIVAADIFGRTEAFEQLAAAIAPVQGTCQVVDPYQGRKGDFAHEEEAYAAFLAECGHALYAEFVASAIAAAGEMVVLVGFSAGASAAWKAVGRGEGAMVRHLIGFYPSQIRHSQDVVPSCPVTLIFPSGEEHFDVQKVMAALSLNPMVECLQTGLGHGFMNPCSRAFSSQAAAMFTRVLAESGKAQVQAIRKTLRSLSFAGSC